MSPYSQMGTYLAAWGTTDQQNTAIERRIGEAQDQIENYLQIYFFYTRCVTRPVTVGLTRGVDYDVEQDGYPFNRIDFKRIATLYMRKRPVVSVARAGIRVGNQAESIGEAEFPEGWITPQAKLGVVHILPILGTSGAGVATMIVIPVVLGFMPGSASIPGVFSIDYTAGYFPLSFNPETDDPADACPDFNIGYLLRAVRLRAAANVLRSLGRAVSPGGGSIGMDGFSQSWGGDRFGSDIKDYDEQAQSIITEFSGNFPIPMFSA